MSASLPPGVHQCVADDCGHLVASHLLMCPRHWGMVPKDIQRAVWDAWNRYRRERSYASARAHTDAARAARRAVRELEERTAAARREQGELF